MRQFLVFIFLICLIPPATSLAQGLVGDDLQFPYEALVLREDAPIRSGPGEVHYATDKLAAGTLLQVYRHDPGGWCAIRPPSGSFSLVPESAIEIVEDNVGRVISGSAQAWVGTRLGVVERPLWQVRLKENELVGILGEVSWPNPEGHSTIWFQIEPPAGEFRWVQISDLQLPDESTGLPSEDPLEQQISKPLVQPAPAMIAEAQTEILQAQPAMPKVDMATANRMSVAESGDKTIVDANVEPAILQTESQVDTIPDTPAKSINSGWKQASRKINRSSSVGKHVSKQTPNQFTAPAIPSPVSRAASENITGNQNVGMRVASANLDYDPLIQQAPRPSEATRIPSNNPLLRDSTDVSSDAVFSDSARLSQLEMLLTNEMLKQPGDWKLAELLLQTEAAINSATDPTVTLHGNRLIEKIRRCQAIRSQYRSAYNDDAMANTGQSGTMRRAVGTGIDTEVEFGSTYDAFGWLRELKSRNDGSSKSTYVLQDESGKVTHHIAGSPGLNLHRYLESKIGIIGQRGYHQGLNLDHVTAERIIELNKRR